MACWDGCKAKGKGKDRLLFLCENILIGTKKNEKRLDKKEEITYSFKFAMKVIFQILPLEVSRK